jgi:endonuclease III
MHQRLGHLDPNKIYRFSINELARLVDQLPKKPRYVDAAPRTIQGLTKIVVDRYRGNAAQIWTNKSAIEVRKTFLSVYGVGTGIANMAVLLIEKAFGIHFSELDHTRMDIKPDVNTMRVLYRMGVAAAIQEDEAISAARYLNPSYPGEIDSALWLIGRQWCTAQDPACHHCPMNEVCSKIFH